MLQELGPAHLPHPRDLVQGGALDPALPLLAVELDGEAVGLLLDLPDEGEHRRDGLNADLPAVGGHQGPGAVAVVLHHTEGGDVQVHGLQHPLGHPHVVFTAVDQQQIRFCIELLVPVQVPAEPPGEHLLHGGVVVRAVHVLELEMPVVPLQGAAVLKDHHRGHDVVGAGVGDVVGLHPTGRLAEAQHLPQGLQQLVLPLLPGGGPLHLLHGVLVGQLDQVHLGPPLGGDQLHPVPHLLGEHPGKGYLVGQLAGQQDLLGQTGAPPVVLPDEGGQDLVLVLLHGGLQQLHVLGRQVPVHIVEDHKAALGGPPEEARHVGIRQGTGHHLLPGPQQLDGPQPVPDLRRLFKAQLLRRRLHLGGEVRLHLFEAALQQGDRLGDGLVVLGLQILRAAVAVALAHVEVEAGPLLSDVPGKLLPAGGQAQGGAQGVQNVLGAVSAGVGAEVPGPVLRHPAGQGKSWVLLPGQADIGVALVVL